MCACGEQPTACLCACACVWFFVCMHLYCLLDCLVCTFAVQSKSLVQKQYSIRMSVPALK